MRLLKVLDLPRSFRVGPNGEREVRGFSEEKKRAFKHRADYTNLRKTDTLWAAFSGEIQVLVGPSLQMLRWRINEENNFAERRLISNGCILA